MSRKKETIIPYSEPYYYTNPSPYYTKDHLKFAAKVRDFVNKELIPNSNKWDQKKTYPIELHKKAYKYGLYSVTFDKKYCGQKLNNWDYFYYFIFHDEIARCGNGGLVAGLFIALQIGLSPLINSNSYNLINKYAPKICQGIETIALAVTEPSGGSDVSRIKTTAIIDKNNNDFFIVNGEKYFITGYVYTIYTYIPYLYYMPNIIAVLICVFVILVRFNLLLLYFYSVYALYFYMVSYYVHTWIILI